MTKDQLIKKYTELKEGERKAIKEIKSMMKDKGTPNQAIFLTPYFEGREAVCWMILDDLRELED